MDRSFNLGMGMGMSLNDPPPPPQPPQPPQHPSRSRSIAELLHNAEQHSGKLALLGRTMVVDVNDLEFIEDIGHGSCGTVTKRTYLNQVMAVKIMPRSNNTYEMSRILMDIHVICQSFDCPYIVKCFGYFITNTDVQVCMECMATCLDRLLFQIKKPIPERIIGKMSVSIIKALHYLKTKHHIMHRDVKPSNILLDWTGNIKLCDFGISGILIESRAHSKSAGCPLYMGPERLDPHNQNSYDIRSDVWSLGLTLVELATGKYPYAGSEFEMMSKIMSDTPPRLSTDDGFSPEFCDLIEQCLQYKPEDRPNYDALLQHEFIKFHEAEKTDVEEWFAGVMST